MFETPKTLWNIFYTQIFFSVNLSFVCTGGFDDLMVWFEWFCCKHRIFATYTRWFDVMIKRFGSIYMQDGIISWFTWLYGLWRMFWCHGLYGFVVFVYRIVCYCGLNSFALQTRTLWLDVMVYRVMHCIQDGLNGFALYTGWFNVMV